MSTANDSEGTTETGSPVDTGDMGNRGDTGRNGDLVGTGDIAAPGDTAAVGHTSHTDNTSHTDDTVVQAAGCVLWRRSPADGKLELCLVHRPKYDDWSHPKGKLKRGEDPLAGALREVEEETGHRAVPGTRLPTVGYEANGRPKQVRYWAAEAVSGTFTPNNEVDRLLWLAAPAARDRLTQPRDRTLVDALLHALHLA